METVEAEGGLMRQSRREHAKTTKALENNSYESDIEDTIYMSVVAPSAPQLKYIRKKLHLED